MGDPLVGSPAGLRRPGGELPHLQGATGTPQCPACGPDAERARDRRVRRPVHAPRRSYRRRRLRRAGRAGRRSGRRSTVAPARSTVAPPFPLGAGDRNLAPWPPTVQPSRGPAVHRLGHRDPARSTGRPTSTAGTRRRSSGEPGALPLHPGHPPRHVPRPAVDHAPVRRLRHGRGDQRALQVPARGRADRPVVRLRPAHPDGLRLRPPPGRGRGGQGRAWPSTRWPTCASCWPACPLDKVTTSMTINATARHPAAPLPTGGRGAGRGPASKLGGTIQNDILKEYVARGTYIYPPRPSMRLITDTFAYCARATSPAGTPSPSPATTSAKPVRRRSRRSPSPSPTASPTSRRRSPPASTSTRSPPGCQLLLERPQQPLRGGGQVPGGPAHVGQAS